MWNVKWLGAPVHILKKAAELGPFNLLKGLITGNDPLCYVSLEGVWVKCLFLVIWSV
jgi:hypothetical protein